MSILASGVADQTLGSGFVGLCHEVMIGTRDTSSDKMRGWREWNWMLASVGSPAEAAEFGRKMVLATLETAADKVIDLAKPETIAGKLLIDSTNPLDFSKGMPPQGRTTCS